MSASPSLRAELEAQKARSRLTPEQRERAARAVEDLRRSGIAGRAVHVGDRAPDFALPNVRGEEIRLGDLLGRGAVVLAFYRGGW